MVSVEVLLRRFSLTELVCSVVALDNRGLSIGVVNLIGLGLLRYLCLWRSPASMCRWISPVFIAKEPLYAALAVEMLGSTSPLTLRAINDTEAIFDFELLELDVNLVTTFITNKISGVSFLRYVGAS